MAYVLQFREAECGHGSCRSSFHLTLNQRAQGSSPCAPTNDFSLYSLLDRAFGCDAGGTLNTT
jgi:hypothetical protein